MSGIELVLMAASTAAMAAGKYAEGQQTAAIQESEAASLRQRAEWEQATSQRNAELEQKKASELVSDQRARFAASGGGTGGSAANVMAQTAARGEFNAMLTQAQGEELARGLEDQARVKKVAARGARTGGMIGAAGTTISGGAAFGRAGGFNSSSYRAG